MTNRRELADRLDLIVAELQGLPHVVQSCREAARLLREPVAGEVEEIVRLVVERAEQACRYALKHQNFEADDDGTDRYRDGWETAAEVCEMVIADHVARHINDDLAALRARLDAEGKGGET